MLNIVKIVGDNIRRLRGHKDWTQEQLALAMGWPAKHKTIVSGLERGDRGLSIKMLEHLCQVLDCFPDELFKMDGEDGDLILRQLHAEIEIMNREDVAALCAHAVALNAQRGIKP